MKGGRNYKQQPEWSWRNEHHRDCDIIESVATILKRCKGTKASADTLSDCVDDARSQKELCELLTPMVGRLRVKNTPLC
jgi:hypothetical protein